MSDDWLTPAQRQTRRDEERRDIANLRRECDEARATVRELTDSLRARMRQRDEARTERDALREAAKKAVQAIGNLHFVAPSLFEANAALLDALDTLEEE